MGCIGSSEENLDSRDAKKMRGKETSAQLSCEMRKEPEVTRPSGPASKYHITPKVLGAGGFGKVYLAKAVEDPEIKFAIKVINKRQSRVSLKEIQAEIDILNGLDHPNIVKYYETFQDSKYVFIVTEYCPNGDLYDKIKHKVQESGCYKESEAAKIMKTLLKAVNHCHSLKICHRDIKPENIMIGEDDNIKLIDFGLSQQIMEKSPLSGAVGSKYYIAPEVFEGEYGLKCDVWSLGVILYILLSGYLPFQGTKTSLVVESIKKGDLDFSQTEWNSVTEEGMDLVKKMLETDQDKRYSVSQCLDHPWFKVIKDIQGDENKDPLDTNVLRNLKDFKSVSALRRKAMNVLVKYLTSSEIKELKELFYKIDTDNSGYIDSDELAIAMQKADENLTSEEIDQIIKEIDVKGNNKINYTEFLAATLDAKQTLTSAKLLTLFKEFDIDNSGHITFENLQNAFTKFGNPISKSELMNALDKHDLEKDGKISYEEFKAMLTENGTQKLDNISETST